MSSDDEWLSAVLAAARSEEDQALERARAEALAKGKEPFDLDRLYALWPWCPDGRLSQAQRERQRPELARSWATDYYLRHPEVMTLEDFASLMRELQSQGAFD
ncbi:hypothetical protein G6O69_38680 [Pseudenhygromyxa sp. WMMC2535]|uniref:hypothetical protein n=1 Tax=Pseudenhygromyxa sp. WMMC2535 TaxID=2712867 RepID=UPI001556E85A|nr:hypothetical protein [Pseudenhygromyxa sp. WMMC2535]NVB43135.1 hypothetical protein [Pseudenhygromyxa sp. WMMC2535]NVB43720.1 hypothetical protein [Pseudenhygromyxa sp. WMMC2535]NVB43787.1 hypothetical protein [Pseudenhygromyxa sp. WMMC2535]